MMDMMNRIDIHQTGPLSNEDRLFMSASVGRPDQLIVNASVGRPDQLIVNASVGRPQSAPTMSCVGGKMVMSQQQFPVNGQQLQMQLDQLTSAMTDITVNDDEMEMASNPAYNQYIQQRLEAQPGLNPFSQEEKRRNPVYASMAAHTTHSPTHDNSSQIEHQQQQQQQQQQEQQEKQQYFLAFLEQQQISEQQFLEQQQYYLQLLEQQYAHHQQLQQQHQQQIQQQQLQDQQLQLQQLQINAVVIPNSCIMPADDDNIRPRLLKRPDLIPIQKCTMWI